MSETEECAYFQKEIMENYFLTPLSKDKFHDSEYCLLTNLK